MVTASAAHPNSVEKLRKSVDMRPFRRLYPFTSRWARINGFDLHYLDEGRGDPILMLHGNPTWSFFFRELVKGLSPGYRCIVPDHIGCGLSAKPGVNRYDYRLQSRVRDLSQFMAHLNPARPVTLVLHDWGGAIGMTYAVSHPERIRRLVLLNTAAFFPPGGKTIPARLRVIRNFPALATFLVQGLNLFSVTALYLAAAKRLPADVRAGLTAPYNSWHNRIATLKFVQDIPSAPGDPSYSLLAETADRLHRLAHLPTLICWGERDAVFDGDYLAEWRRRFPRAQVCSMPDAGHYILEDNAPQVLAEIQTFLIATDTHGPDTFEKSV